MSESSSGDTRSLKEKLLGWLPRHHLTQLASEEDLEPQPDWSQEFWSPIDMDASSSDPVVTLCKLNFKKYSSAPHLYPMFRDLVGISDCFGSNKRREHLSRLLEEVAAKEGTPEGRTVPPSAFVFHESRVGSTLVANELASDPWSMVFSESAPAAAALLNYSPECDNLGNCQKNIDLFRKIVTLMGRSPFHKRLFFKFQSATVPHMHIALEAFPKTPWGFVFRQPVQTMMSHLDPQKGSLGAPCLRSMRDTPKEVVDSLTEVVGSGFRANAPKEAWCAAHLNMLCTHALNSFSKYSVYAEDSASNTGTGNSNSNERTSSMRGMLINYESLPGVIPRVFLPMAGITPSTTWIRSMSAESTFYSKGRGKVASFKGDSEDKEQRSTQAIQQYAKSLLESNFVKLKQLSMDSLNQVAPEIYNSLVTSASKNTDSEPDWSILSVIPPKGFKAKYLRNLSKKEKNLISARYAQTDGSVPEQARQQVIPADGSKDSVAFLEAAKKAQSDPKRINSGENSNSAETEEEDDDDSAEGTKDNDSYFGHSKFPKVPYAPWAPFANTHSSKPFDKFDCPDTPPPGYPHTYFMTDITANWNTDSTEIPPFHYDSLCHFDYSNQTEFTKALAYRTAELPFVVYNMPEVDKVARQWSDIDYLHKKLGNKKYRTELSKDNHFMYWMGGGPRRLRDGQQWTPPTDIVSVTFEHWLEMAIKGQNKTLENRTHEYFRLSSDMGNPWLFDELPFFQPKPSFFVVDPKEQKGIHCRFGMRSVIAEAHFDGSRNVIALMGGMRRYILTHPDQCVNMHMLPYGHPSSRHSEIDWSKPDPVKFPNWLKLKGNEVIMQPGDVLYLPTFWIHYIISLDINYQCNTRSGKTNHFDADIRKCGF